MKLGRRAGFAVLLVFLGYLLVLASVGMTLLSKGQLVAAPLVMAVLWLGAPGVMAPAVLFWLAAAPQFMGIPRITRTVRYGFVVLAMLWVVYWALHWPYGVFKFGLTMMLRLVVINLAAMSGLYSLVQSWKKAPSMPKATLFCWLLALWVFTVAFLRLG